MKATTIYLCGISLGVAVFIVSVVEGVTWLALVSLVTAYGSAFGYRQEIRRPRKKGARR